MRPEERKTVVSFSTFSINLENIAPRKLFIWYYKYWKVPFLVRG